MIGYYVHHHGAGHAHRFLAVRRHLPGLVGLGSGPRPPGLAPDDWVELPLDDTEAVPRDPTAGGTLHWAPLGERGLRRRTAAIAAWVDANAPSAMVVDVSVEVALLARLLSVPTVVVAQHGDRTDPPHRLAYRSASAVAALWNAGDVPDPPSAAGRLVHVGPISRFDAEAAARPVPRRTPARERADGDHRTRVVVLVGHGGHDLDARAVADTIAATRDTCRWDVIGPLDGVPHRLADAPDVWAALSTCDVVVAPASNNCVAEVAAAGARLLVLPQARPFDEQVAHAAVLRRRGLATVLDAWPEATHWNALLDQTMATVPAWSGYRDGHGAARLADVVLAAAR